MVKRHQAILELLDKDNYISVSHLSELLKVSAVTIRKDLKLLEDKGLVYRTHGGASIQNPYINDRHVSEKEKLNVSEKEAIAKAAAELITVNDSIMIASGTTMQYLAIAISIDGPINVTTSSLNVALELTKSSQYSILQLGGNVRHSSFSVTGHFSHAILENISCKLLFLGADGIDVNHGCTTTSLEEAMLNKKMMGSAQKVIVLADSSKFNRKGFGKICMLSEVDLIITDSGLNKNIQQDILDAGVELHIAQ
jgi:DeoR family transcriptional regulator of aga operon